jgi:hypothetical protein
MRRGLGLLFAISLCVPVGVATAGSAGSATNTKLPKCKALQGVQTYKPGLPIITSKKLVKPITTTTLTITGCIGGGIKSGKSNSTVKATKGTNCAQLVKNAGKPGAASKGVITWSNGQKSTTSNVLTVTSKPGASPIIAKLVSKYVGGLGKGHQSTVTLKATPNAGFCTKKPFTKSTFKSTKIVTK